MDAKWAELAIYSYLHNGNKKCRLGIKLQTLLMIQHHGPGHEMQSGNHLF